MAATYEDRFWTSSDGLNLHYRNYPGPDAAEKLPVLCLHGLTRNARDFAALAEALSAKRRVIVPEMRGRGLSDYAPDSDTYSPLTYVTDVEKLLTEQGITRLVVIGTSMGGLMTMLMAAAKPGRMSAVVMNDIGPELNPDGIARISGYVGQGRSYPTWVHAARALETP
jgi:pimeloyl-ACP methyl ester carboxylesterase